MISWLLALLASSQVPYELLALVFYYYYYYYLPYYEFEKYSLTRKIIGTNYSSKVLWVLECWVMPINDNLVG